MEVLIVLEQYHFEVYILGVEYKFIVPACGIQNKVIFTMNYRPHLKGTTSMSFKHVCGLL